MQCTFTKQNNSQHSSSCSSWVDTKWVSSIFHFWLPAGCQSTYNKLFLGLVCPPHFHQAFVFLSGRSLATCWPTIASSVDSIPHDLPHHLRQCALCAWYWPFATMQKYVQCNYIGFLFVAVRKIIRFARSCIYTLCLHFWSGAWLVSYVYPISYLAGSFFLLLLWLFTFNYDEILKCYLSK